MLYAFCTQKGGVGKSTLSVHAAVWLSEKGKNVAVVDADAQASSSMWLKEASPALPVFRLMTPDDVLNELPRIQAEFEYVIFDGPGAISEVNRAALLLADTALLPCGPTVLDLWSTDTTAALVRQAQMIRKGPPQAIFIPSKVRRRHRMSAEFVETAKSFGIPVSRGIRLLDSYADAVGQGTVVWRMGPRAIEAGTEIQQLFMEIMADVTINETTDERRAQNG